MDPSDQYQQFQVSQSLYGPGPQIPPDQSQSYRPEALYPSAPQFQYQAASISPGAFHPALPVPDVHGFQNPLAPYFPSPQAPRIALDQLAVSAAPVLEPAQLISPGTMYGQQVPCMVPPQGLVSPSMSTSVGPASPYSRVNPDQSMVSPPKPPSDVPSTDPSADYSACALSSESASTAKNGSISPGDKVSPSKKRKHKKRIPKGESLVKSPDKSIADEPDADFSNPPVNGSSNLENSVQEDSRHSASPTLNNVQDTTAPAQSNEVDTEDSESSEPNYGKPDEEKATSPVLLASSQPVSALIGEKPPVKAKVVMSDLEIIQCTSYDSETNRYNCRLCNYSSQLESKIHEHVEAHNGKYVCHLCSKAFVKGCDLQRHVESHARGKSKSLDTGQHDSPHITTSASLSPLNTLTLPVPVSCTPIIKLEHLLASGNPTSAEPDPSEQNSSKDKTDTFTDYHKLSSEDPGQTSTDGNESGDSQPTHAPDPGPKDTRENLFEAIDRTLLGTMSHQDQGVEDTAPAHVSTQDVEMSGFYSSPPITHDPPEGHPPGRILGEIQKSSNNFYKCHLCSYNGRSWKSYVKHYRAHEQKYKMCHLCSRAFERPSDLKRHLDRHERDGEGSKPFVPRPPDNYVPPVRPVKGKVYHCKQCSFSSHMSQKLAIHVRVTHKGWFQCNVCQQKFISKRTLESHKAQRHPANILRIDQYQQSVVTGTRVIHFNVEEDNEITLTTDPPDEFSLNYGEIPDVSKCADLRTILHKNKQESGQLPNYIGNFMKLNEISASTTSKATSESLVHSPDVYPQPPPLIPRPDLVSPVKHDASMPDISKDPPTLTNMVTDMSEQEKAPTLSPEPDRAPILTAEPETSISEIDGAKCPECEQVFDSTKTMLSHLIKEHTSKTDYIVKPKKKHKQVSPVLPENDDVSSSSNTVIVLQNPAQLEQASPSKKANMPEDNLPNNIVIGTETPFKTLPSSRAMTFVCERCNYGTNVESKFDEHLRAHSGRFICKVCKKACIKSSDLFRHWVTHNVKGPNGEYICDSCDYTSPVKHDVSEHMKIHYYIHHLPDATAVKPTFVRCGICKKRVLRKHIFLHKKNVHGRYFAKRGDSDATYSGKTNVGQSRGKEPKPAMCPDCPAIFDTLQEMEAHHNQTHTGSKADDPSSFLSGFPCSLCQQIFTSPEHLKNHEEECHKPFDTPSSKEDYGSDDVDFQPSRSPARRKGKRSSPKSNAKFKCNVCGKKLRCKYYMAEHMKLHSGEKAHKCSTCGAEFALKATYQRHVKNSKCSATRQRSNIETNSSNRQERIRRSSRRSSGSNHMEDHYASVEPQAEVDSEHDELALGADQLEKLLPDDA